MSHLRAPVLLVCALLLVLILSVPALGAGRAAQRNVPYDQSPVLKNMPAPVQTTPGLQPDTTAAPGDPDPPLHDGRPPDLVLTLFDFSSVSPGPHDVPFWREASGVHSDIYVGWNDLIPPPTSSQQSHVLTPVQIDYMSGEFDQRIWESDVFHFGNYAPRAPAQGIDGSRAGIFIYNIRDEAYHSDFRFYIAGFFWAALNETLQINAIFVDSFDWANRLGPAAERPFLYEGVVAHEFEHLIHNDVDPDEDSFIDEGMADLAEQFIYGPATTASHVGAYMVQHRDSLTDWDGELYDYGNAVLWQDYLWETAGGGILTRPLAERVAPGFAGNMFADTGAKFADPGDRFTWNLIHEQGNGLQGLASSLGGLERVEALHRDFTLANLLDGKVALPQWNYRNLVLGGPDSDGFTIDDGLAFFANQPLPSPPPTRKQLRRLTTVESWGAFYRTLQTSEADFAMRFSGNRQDGIAPASAPFDWFSGFGHGLQRTLSRTAEGVAAGSVLEFQTWFDIEQDFDYGYVEASADGETWSKLTQLTLLPSAMANIFGSEAFDGPGGFTGNSGGWQLARFALGEFSGTVHIRFRYATDGAVNGLGWRIDDITLGAFTDSVADPGDWTSDGWVFGSGIQDNDWTADVWLPGSLFGVVTAVGLPGLGFEGISPRITPRDFRGFRVYSVVGNRPNGPFNATGLMDIQR